jgi:hypothetical protein
MTRSPVGGEYTLLNRVRCFLVGHDRAEEPSVKRGRYHAYLCRRCNDFAAIYDCNEKAWFRTFNEAHAYAGRASHSGETT